MTTKPGLTARSTRSILRTQSKSSAKSSWRGRKSKRVKIAGSRSDKPPQENLLSSSPKGRDDAGSSRRGRPRARSEKHITRFSADELSTRPPGKTDWAKVDALSDEDIARAVAQDPDAAPINLDWSNAVIITPERKKALSIRLDPDVFAYFKSTGRGYQTRINAVLRHYVEHEQKKKARE
jgi:uncharacterized protein (DUF4415 family)